jgi:hypothetical protein
MARDINFDQSILYRQLLRSAPTNDMLEPASKLQSGEPAPTVEPPHAPYQQLLKAKPRPTNPIDDWVDNIIPLPASLEPDQRLKELERDLKSAASASSSPTRSEWRKISPAMIIKPGPKTHRAALNSEDADQWKEAIGKVVSSMDSHGVQTCVVRAPGDASIIESRWVMGGMLLANGQTEKWKVRLVGRGDQQRPGDYNDITYPGIDSASVRLVIGLAAKHVIGIAVLEIPTAFLGCTWEEALYIRLLHVEWPDDPDCQARPIVKLHKTSYGTK